MPRPLLHRPVYTNYKPSQASFYNTNLDANMQGERRLATTARGRNKIAPLGYFSYICRNLANAAEDMKKSETILSFFH